MIEMELEMIEIESLWVVLIIVAIIGVGIGYAVMQYAYNIHSTGKVEYIGIEIKDAHGNIIKDIDWGNITSNSTKKFYCFAVNNGTVPINLTLSTQNWNPPEAQNYISLTWNYSGAIINPNQSQCLTLALTVSPEISGISNFGFDIVITAKEVE